MNSLIDYSITHSRTILSLLILILLSGSVAFLDIAKEAEPDIDLPIIYVSLSLEGVSPEDAERLLIRPMEQELSSIEGVKEMRAAGYEGGGNIVMEFSAGFDKDKAMDDVQKAVDQARSELPDDSNEPKVKEVNFSLFPVLVVTLSGDVPERTLLKIIQDLQDRIEGVSTVLEAPIAGERDEQVEIIINPLLLESYGLDGGKIIETFTRSNKLVAAGNLDTGAGRFAIKVPGIFENVSDIMNIPLRTVGDSTIRVADIVDIRRNFKDPENFARLNGQPALAIEIVKRPGENIIETIEAVRDITLKAQESWPESVQLHFTQDKSERIRTQLSDLQNNVISAVLLVMIVVVAALGLRSALLVGVAIPGAFLSGILFLYMTGLTLNMVVLFALILSVGLLVDGAIVVCEFAERRMSEGKSKVDAYSEAAKRMFWPITASTATTLAAFAPLLFWPGIVGEFMGYLPLTLIAVLASSLAMALIFMPTVGAIFGKPREGNVHAALDTPDDVRAQGGLIAGYANVLEACLRRPFLILVAAFSLLIGVQYYYATHGNGVEFFPDIEPETASILVHARGNLSIHEKDVLVKQVENRILKFDYFDSVYTRTGAQAASGSDLPPDVIGQIALEFKDWQERPSANEIMPEILTRMVDIAGIHVEVRKDEAGPASGKAVEVQISSRSPDLLPVAVEQVYAGMNDVGEFIDREDTLPLPGIEWELKVDRAQAAKFGLDLVQVGNYVRMVTNGLEVTEYRPDDSEDELDVIIRHALDERTLLNLDRLRIQTAQGLIPISNFVERIPKPAVGTINRVDQRRAVTVKADVPAGVNVSAKIVELKQWLSSNQDKFDPRVNIEFKGEDEDQKEAQSFLVKAFGIALFLMAIILVTQFNSFYNATLILSAVIMSTIGVMLGLLITGEPFGIVMSGIGVIALAGIIVNNNIVLIDTYDVLKREKGHFLDARDIILLTGAQRLRAVLLTTVTTVLGLLPMVLQMNIDFTARSISIGAPSSQWWVQLSTAICFGLIFSTLLTLIVTPCALMARERFKAWRGGRNGVRNRKNPG